MSHKSRNIALSAAAVLLVAGGAYSFMGDTPDAVSYSADPMVSSLVDAKPAAPSAENTVNAPVSQKADGAAQTPLAEPVAPVQKKLTKQQLTPPPATEDEKLQKAAEQESNF